MWRVVCKPEQHYQLGEGKKMSMLALNGAIDPPPMENTPSRGLPHCKEDRCSLDICPTSLTLKLLISSARELVNPVKQWAGCCIDTVREGNARLRTPNNTPATLRKKACTCSIQLFGPGSHWTGPVVFELVRATVSRIQRLLMSKYRCLLEWFQLGSSYSCHRVHWVDL